MGRNVNPTPQFFDSAGDPLISGKMYYFESGTNTPKATFADINLTIQNTHPVILTADGRLPNVFFEGTARQKLTDNDDVQIWDKDPVGGQNIGGDFEAWSPQVIYNVNDIVEGSDGKFYLSFTNGNENNDPITSPGFWQQIEFINIWNTNVDYPIGTTVKASDNNFYKGLVTPNAGNDPISSPTEWGSPFNVASATDTAEGVVELATQVEVNTGTDAGRVITPETLTNWNGIPAAMAGFYAKNMIRNPNMVVSQRGPVLDAGGVDAVYLAVDGSKTHVVTAPQGRFDTTQDSDVPAGSGLHSSLKIDCTVAEAAVAANEAIGIAFPIEAQDLQHLDYGAAGAVTTTKTIWIKSPKAGAHSFAIHQPDGTRYFVHEITVADADTWEKFSFQIPGDTGGTINNDTGEGWKLIFPLVAGSDFDAASADTWTAGTRLGPVAGSQNLLDNVANNIFIAGLDFEVGSESTPFPIEPFSVTLAKCLRYYWRWTGTTAAEYITVGANFSTTLTQADLLAPVEMRAAPTGDRSGATDFVVNHSGGAAATTAVAFDRASTKGIRIAATVASGLTDGGAGGIAFDGTNGRWIELDAEM